MAFHALTQWEHERRGEDVNLYIQITKNERPRANQISSTFQPQGVRRNRPPAPGMKPENLGRMKWPHVKTTKYKEVSCH